MNRGHEKVGTAMSLRAYARSRGVSPAAVHKAIASGRIARRPDGLIDSKEADELWERNTRPKLVAGAGSLVVERTRRERAQASLAELELARAAGVTIEVDEAARLWESAIERIRARMLASVSLAAPKVVGVTSIKQANAVLEAIVYDALTAAASVAEEIAGCADRF